MLHKLTYNRRIKTFIQTNVFHSLVSIQTDYLHPKVAPDSVTLHHFTMGRVSKSL